MRIARSLDLPARAGRRPGARSGSHAIGDLAGEAAGVHDRTLSLYLASADVDVERALDLAEAELTVRKDIYGYDALAWALLANGRAAEARAAMTEAFALGTRDAKLLFDAGMIEAALDNDAEARTFLQAALATDPSFDPAAVRRARGDPRRAAMSRQVTRAAGLAIVVLLAVPLVVLAHPLGNFTINHYAGLRIEPDRVLLDVVIDQAEIPAFQARQALDLDEDGQLSDPEIERGRLSSCEALGPDLALVVDGSARELRLVEAGLSLPPGVGGLPTLRLVCGFEATLDTPVTTPTRFEFEDRSYPNRLGWREIVVEGSGVTVAAADGELRVATESARLTNYPQARLDAALADARVAVTASPGGRSLPAWDIADATPVETVEAGSGVPAASRDPVLAGGVVPGGVEGEIPALFGTADLTPIVLLASLLTAAALGAGHALTPGHGKTLMAAYLVGTRGTPVHAFGLGLSVSVSHTIGILLLALLVVGAQGVLSPDLVVRFAPLVAAVTIVAIGGWMLLSELRRRAAVRAAERAHAVAHASGAHHEHPDDPDNAASEHRHGAVRHSHLPPAGAGITWRSLFVLGLAGGIIPSTNALLILLGTIAAGRPAFGVVLVVAFGLGMALVMAGVGLVMILARGRLDLVSGSSPIGRLREWLPLGAACVVLGLGLVLTIQAVASPPRL